MKFPQLRVRWLDAGCKPQYPPDPLYPNGIKVDLSRGASVVCEIALPYPAPRCGQWMVSCRRCGQVNIITAAGRVDDPRSVRIACHATSNFRT